MKLDRVKIEITREGWTIVGFDGDKEQFRIAPVLTRYGWRPRGDLEEILGGSEALEADESLDELYEVLDELVGAPYEMARYMGAR
jgi:hypothetical protein